MSLRDQLLKAGLASKKDVRRVEQSLKKERRTDQAHRRSAAEVEAEEKAAAAAAAEAELAARLEARRAHEATRTAHERAVRAKNLVEGNKLGVRKGRVPFHHRRADGRTLHRLWVDDRTAWQLRCGELAVVRHPEREDYVVVRQAAAKRLLDVAPELVVFYVEDTKGISDRDEAFLRADWEPSLTPRRAE